VGLRGNESAETVRPTMSKSDETQLGSPTNTGVERVQQSDPRVRKQSIDQGSGSNTLRLKWSLPEIKEDPKEGETKEGGGSRIRSPSPSFAPSSRFSRLGI